jgi:hypothetical protein
VLEQGKALRFHLGHTLWVRWTMNALDGSAAGSWRLARRLWQRVSPANGAERQPAAASASPTAGTSP